MSGISHWGISPEVVKAHFGNKVRYSGEDSVLCGNYLRLRVLPSDCGSVIMSGISEATLDDLKNAIEYCRLSGYSLLIGTVVYDKDEKMVGILGFTVKTLGPSHRNPHKTHRLVHFHIPESKFEVFGYKKTEK